MGQHYLGISLGVYFNLQVSPGISLGVYFNGFLQFRLINSPEIEVEMKKHLYQIHNC